MSLPGGKISAIDFGLNANFADCEVKFYKGIILLAYFFFFWIYLIYLILVQYSDKFMHSIVKFLIVLLHSLLLCFCTVLLCEVNTIQCHA